MAILPIRGKILNVERSRIDKMLNNTEVQALISAIGAGFGEEFDLEKIRYHKIVLLADADVDGSHIRTLLLTFSLPPNERTCIKRPCLHCATPLFSTEVKKSKIYLKDEHAKDLS